jgi:hypothetical protein
MAVLLIGIVMIALFTPGPPTLPAATTVPQVQEGGTVSIGQPFILKFGTDEVPVRIVFDSAWLTTTHEYWEAESGYKLLVIRLTVQNIGTREVDTFHILDKWEVRVDKGYVYDSKSQPYLVVRPEEKKTGYVIFEILEHTNPVEVSYRPFLSTSVAATLNLKGYGFATTTVAAKESLSLESYEWRKGSALTLRIRNYGSVTATIDKVYIDALLASDEDGLIKPGSVIEIVCSNPSGLSLERPSTHKVRVVTMVGNIRIHGILWVG